MFVSFFFFFNDPATTEIYTLSLHDALPISGGAGRGDPDLDRGRRRERVLPSRGLSALPVLHHRARRSEEHTSELQSRFDLVCRLLLEKKKRKNTRLRCTRSS